MVLAHVVIHVRHLHEALLAVRAGVRLLACVLRADVSVQAALLGEGLIARGADVLGEVRVLVIHDQALLRLWRRPAAARHLAVPHRPIIGDGIREVRQRELERHFLRLDWSVPATFPAGAVQFCGG